MSEGAAVEFKWGEEMLCVHECARLGLPSLVRLGFLLQLKDPKVDLLQALEHNMTADFIESAFKSVR